MLILLSFLYLYSIPLKQIYMQAFLHWARDVKLSSLQVDADEKFQKSVIVARKLIAETI